MMQHAELCLRLIIAFVVGGLVGMERSQRYKEAGIRTHILVCCTTALIMLISKYGFADLTMGGASDFLGTKGPHVSRRRRSAASAFCARASFSKWGATSRG